MAELWVKITRDRRSSVGTEKGDMVNTLEYFKISLSFAIGQSDPNVIDSSIP